MSEDGENNAAPAAASLPAAAQLQDFLHAEAFGTGTVLELASSFPTGWLESADFEEIAVFCGSMLIFIRFF